MTIPPELAAAITRHHSTRPPAPPTERTVTRGDLRVVRPSAGGDSRVVLVASTAHHHGRQWCTVVLCHPWPELATSVDVVIPAALCHTPYTVVVQGDLAGCVWADQLGPAVGHIDGTTLDAANTVGDEMGPAGNGLWCGVALAGPGDSRWDHKAGEGVALRRLCQDCTGTLLAT